jgi:hypothetical protein
MSNRKKPNSPWLRGQHPGNVIVKFPLSRKMNRRRQQMLNRRHWVDEGVKSKPKVDTGQRIGGVI